jgi:serine protease
MKILLTTLTLSLLTSFSTVASQVNKSSASPVIIAVHKSTDVKFSPTQMAKFSINAPENVQEFILESTGASFIKVHFKSFNIPDGAYVVVSDNTSNESYRYDNESTAKRTFNTLAGENGVHQFSAMSVFGETAKVKLVLPLGTQWLPEHKLVIDSYKAGTENESEFSTTPSALINSLTVEGNIDQAPNFETESTCGINERKDVQCWASSNPIEYERTRPVARLLMAGSGLCTAWRVGSQNHMFTNNHCLDNEARLQDTEVWFNYQYTACDGSTLDNVIKVTGKTLFKTDYTLDYSVFSVNSFAAIANFGYFGLEVRSPSQGEQIYIPQHGSGNPKELSIQSDQNSGGLCQIDVSSANGRGTGTDTGYFCDTTGGSSGSPVLASSSNNVIALHHFGGCENQGVRVDKIWPQVASIFGNTIPVGDNDSGGNQEPVPIITDSCTDLACSFNGASSSDTDGTIISYQWSFGDGTSAYGDQAQHNYDSNGNYTVSLTVTDNGGLSSSTNKVISVSSDNDGVLISGVAVSNLSGAKANEQDFYIDTTEPSTRVGIQLSGGSGDADLYVKKGSIPTKTDYDCRPYIGGNNESCDVLLASPGRVHIKLIAYNAYSDASLLATNTTSTPNEFPKSNLTATANNWLRYLYTAANDATVNVSISGGTGDADLYLNKTGAPTTSVYICRPFLSGNNESCSVSLLAGETVYIGIKAYKAFAETTLNVAQ